MKKLLLFAWLCCLWPVTATTITVVQIHEPLSLHGTDGDDVPDVVGEALQATVIPRPMALTGAFPETLVSAIRTPHKLPSNNPNYKTEEANLLVLCNIGLSAVLKEGNQLEVSVDIGKIRIPDDVDLTSRQVLKLTLLSIHKTLEAYQKPQLIPLTVRVQFVNFTEQTESLRDLATTYKLGE